MEQSEIVQNKVSDIFVPKSQAARILVPLLDALNWQGDRAKMIEALVDGAEEMALEGLAETLANLNFRCIDLGRNNAKNIDTRVLPLVIVQKNFHCVVLSIDGKQALIYDAEKGVYRHSELKSLQGDFFAFQYAEDVSDELIQPQNNWFSKLIIRFSTSFMQVVALTLGITLLDLLLPVFVMLIYDRILVVQSLKPILLTATGVLIYIATSLLLNHLRGKILNYISCRMGFIISQQTFTRLVYLSPSFTETASVNAQISRIKDFENIKQFVVGGRFIDTFDLLFSVIYMVAIFMLGGWIGIIPIVTLLTLTALGLVMRPFHKLRMEKLSETSSLRQQNLIEILKNTEDIKMSGSKGTWLVRSQKVLGAHLLSNYKLSDYVNTSNNVSYFLTNASVLVMIYGGVLQVFSGRMSTGALIGVLMLYWKVIGPIRSSFSLGVQISGFLKSVAQINRFMKLPLDTSLKTNMTATKDIGGLVKFTDVSIRYNNHSEPALFNVSFVSKPGEILGITGHDGAGKTTVLKLILGMYKPQGGRITIDHVNIKQLEPLSLRKAISYAPDKDMLLIGTVRDQFIGYNPSITDSRIQNLMLQTGMNEEMERFGYSLDTQLSEEGIRNLSPSFKKRLNVTRMLGREAKLYLVDEPENHLDQASVEKIQIVLQKMAKYEGVSIILSTKDEQLLGICDNVLTLNQGRMRAKA